MASGRVLRAPLTVEAKRRRRRVSAVVRSEVQHIADIRLRWIASPAFPGYPVAAGDITFADGDAWAVSVEAPDRPADSPKFLAGLRRPRYPIWERIVRVRDRGGKVLAEASWPESSGRMLEDRKASNRAARAESRRKVLAAAGAAGRAARSRWRWSERRGTLKWLPVAALAGIVAVGFLPAAIVMLVTGEPGLGATFAVVTVASSWVGVAAWRRWRGPATCWSCGTAIEGRPGTCPSCGAAHPRSVEAGDRGGFARRTSASALRWLALTADRLVMEQSDPTIRVDGGAEILLRSGGRWPGAVGHRLGSLRIERRRRRTRFASEGPVPLEAALLAWVLLTGDVIFPQAAGGGG